MRRETFPQFRDVASASASAQPFAPIRWGSADYRKVSIALFLAGFSTFSLMYCVQPLLPQFSRAFGVDAAVSSLSLSLTTGALAISIFIVGALSRGLPRRGLMLASMALAAMFNVLAAAAPSWNLLLLTRTLEGFALGGVPAVAMAYLAEEIDPKDLGKAMGLYVAGTAFGAMVGRIGMGVMTEMFSWRAAMGVLGVVDVLAAIGFLILLPASRNFTPQSAFQLAPHIEAWGTHLRHSGLRRLFVIGFILTSVFIALYNSIGYRLSAAPFGLGESVMSLIFLAFIPGMFIAPLAGNFADRFGRRLPLAAGLAAMALGMVLTLSSLLSIIFTGVALMTAGFFVAHSVASSTVGRMAGLAKGHAASLYLLLYYLGSSVTGPIGGWFWEHGGWGAVVALGTALSLAGTFIALSLREEGARADFKPQMA